jgi:threonine dehydratase
MVVNGYEFNHPQRIYAEIRAQIHHTPVFGSRLFNRDIGAELYFKCENFQKTGSFKIRGASYAVRKALEKGNIQTVATHSSGNFGQALAYAASMYGISCHIVVPENAPKTKVDAMKGYGAEIEFCKPGTENREQTLKNYLRQKPEAVFIHPYNEINVIEGHTTLACELFLDKIFPDYIIVPVGGGGLISGISIAAAHYFPDCTVIGAEPEGANDAYLSLQKGEIIHLNEVQTVADGLRTSLGNITFSVIKKMVKQIVIVSEEEILLAQKEIMNRMKIVIEPSSATVWAAAKKISAELIGSKTLLVLSGGNTDLF